MNRVSRFVAALALAGVATAAAAQTPARPCLNGPDAEAVMLAVAPAAIKAAGGVCATALPRDAFLLQPDPAFLARMAQASDQAWPRAAAAAGRLAGPDLGQLFQGDAMRPALGVLVAAQIVSDLKPADCPKLDRILTMLSPLPAQNIAALGVTILQYAQDKAVQQGRKPKLPLCPSR
jgi:hypothetical protein